MDKIPAQHKIDYIKYLEGVKSISDNAKNIGKIPAALQHKIDYINALDITARQKAVRTSTEIIDYWADYYRRRNLFIDTGSFEYLFSNLKGKGSWSMDEYEAMKKDSKDLINLNITAIAPKDVFTAKSIAETMKEINSIAPGNTKIKRDGSDWKSFYVTFCFCAAFVLCGAVGLTLGAIFGSSL
jgi:hypothetical protein